MAFSDMYGNVLNRARQSGTWATARAKDYINKAQGVIYRKAKEWIKLEQRDTATGTIGQSHYALPTDFGRPIKVTLTTGTTVYEMLEVSYDSVRAGLIKYTSNDRPTGYCIHYGELLFNRKLDVAYTLTLDYLGIPPDLSSDSDDTLFTDAEYILEEYAYAFLMRDLGHDEKFIAAFNNFNAMLEDYADSDGRGEALHGFYDGREANSPYWSSKRMWGQ